MTPERLQELKRLCDAATPGPWFHKQVGHHHGLCHADTDGLRLQPVDWDLIAQSRTAIPELIEEVERLQGERDKAIGKAMREDALDDLASQAQELDMGY